MAGHEDEKALTVQEAAALLGVTSEAVRQLIGKGQLRATQGVQRRWSINASDVQRLLIQRGTPLPAKRSLSPDIAQAVLAVLEDEALDPAMRLEAAKAMLRAALQ